MKLNFGKYRLRSLIQAEAAECGLCCLAMVAGFYGQQTDLVSLRRTFSISLRGANLRDLMKTAETMKLSPRPLQLALEELKQLKTPAILHWNFDHFVVLAKVRSSGITVHDPAVGIRDYSWAEASKHFTGIALELSPRQDFETGDLAEKLSLWAFWQGAKGLGRSFTIILVLSLLLQIFSLATPFYMQTVVDDVLIKHDQDLLVILALGFLALTLISVVTQVIRGFASLYLVNQLNYNIGNSVLHHLMRLPMSYFEKRHMGDIVSRFGSIGPIQDFISGSLIAVLIDGLLAVTTLTLMFVYSPLLASVAIASVVLYALFRLAQFQPLRNASHENIAANARIDSTFMETIRALQGIKLSGKEVDRQNTWRNQFAETINTNARIGRLTISYEAINSALTGCSYILVIFLGAQNVLENVMTVGMLYAFMSYRSNFSSAVLSIIDLFLQYRMLGLHLERISDITQTEKESGLETESTLILPIQGQLSAKRLSFKYAPQEPPIFADFNIEITPGSFIALHGPSGSGKTTLLKCMMGLLPPFEGEIQIDGLPLSVIGQRSYRQHIAAVMQTDALFSGSLKENIAFFDLTPDLNRIQLACEQACIHEEIMQSPMGYDALVSDMGSSLSAGQQQRVLIARALYQTPKLLFLDEGTAHVDSTTEHQIMANLQSQDLTCIFVTHNQDMLRYADRVVLWQGDQIHVGSAE